MTSTLIKSFIAAMLLSLAVVACDRPGSAKMDGEPSIEFAENRGNMRCVLRDGQEFCASSRMREAIERSPVAAL